MAELDDTRDLPTSPPKMPFIVSSSTEKADPATRRLIRSHVMRGKKKRKRRPDLEQRTTSSGTIGASHQIVRVKLEDVVEIYTPPQVPGRVGSDLSLVEFADDIELSMLLSILKVSTIAMKITFPLLVASGLHVDTKAWVYLIGLDAAALHITAFAMEGFADRILRHQQSNVNVTAMLHFQKGLMILRERLLGDDDEAKVSDSTMGVVMKLASSAHFNGDYQSSKHHIEGLRKMVNLRGGLDVFKGKHLLVEMLRCDLGVALLNGSSHVFFRQPSEPLTEYPEILLPISAGTVTSPCNLELMGNIDSDLVTAWRVMERFCFLVDLGRQTHRFIPLEIIHETMAAVMYRLLGMSFANGSLDEAIWYGLLAFSYHIFLQWQDVNLPYRHFPVAYRKSILYPRPDGVLSAPLTLWLLMTGANSVLNASEELWLKDLLQEYCCKCGVKKWKELQKILKSFMWIALLDDQPGENIYDLVTSR